MAAAETARLVAQLDLKDGFTGPAKKAQASLQKLDSTAFKVGQNIGTGISNAAANIKKLAVIGGGLAVTGLAFAIKQASDLNESLSKTQVVFGKAAASVIAFSKTAASALGLTQQEALEAGASFGNMFKTVGLAQPKAAAMSKTMVKLAADMASFNNEDPNEMLDKLRSGLAGEAEPLRRFGVLLSEAAVKAEAHALGLDKTDKNGKKVKKTLTEADKVLARYSLIMKQTSLQQGDFGRTSGGLANQMRILRANVTDAAAKIGTALLPAVARIAQNINKLITQNQPAIQAFADQLPAAFSKLEDFAMNLPWGAIKDAFVAMGTGARFLLNAFLGLPPWVQTAVLTGWGLNKLTGGALTNIFGTLAQGLIKGVLGMNAGVVNINAGVVNGAGGVAGAAGAAKTGLGLVSKMLLVGEAIGLVVAVNEVRQAISDQSSEQAAAIQSSTSQLIANQPPIGDLQTALAGVNQGIHDLEFNPLNVLVQGDALDKLREMRDQLQAAIAARNAPDDRPKIAWDALSTAGKKLSQAVDRWNITQSQRDDRPKIPPPVDIAAIIKASQRDDRPKIDTKALQDSFDRAIIPTTNAVEAVQNTAGSGLSNVNTSTMQTRDAVESARSQVQSSGTMVQGAAALAGYRAAAATNAASSNIVGAIQANRPIIDVQVNISATTIEKTVTVTDRNGPSGGSATDDLGYPGHPGR